MIKKCRFENEIEKLDKQIDQEVYKLYNLYNLPPSLKLRKGKHAGGNWNCGKNWNKEIKLLQEIVLDWSYD